MPEVVGGEGVEVVKRMLVTTLSKINTMMIGGYICAVLVAYVQAEEEKPTWLKGLAPSTHCFFMRKP